MMMKMIGMKAVNAHIPTLEYEKAIDVSGAKEHIIKWYLLWGV
jgi:hypothetical protein